MNNILHISTKIDHLSSEIRVLWMYSRITPFEIRRPQSTYLSARNPVGHLSKVYTVYIAQIGTCAHIELNLIHYMCGPSTRPPLEFTRIIVSAQLTYQAVSSPPNLVHVICWVPCTRGVPTAGRYPIEYMS